MKVWDSASRGIPLWKCLCVGPDLRERRHSLGDTDKELLLGQGKQIGKCEPHASPHFLSSSVPQFFSSSVLQFFRDPSRTWQEGLMDCAWSEIKVRLTINT